MEIIISNKHNILFKKDNRYYIVESNKELIIDNAWCDCRTLKQAIKELNNY